jgi:hypothetical protein
VGPDADVDWRLTIWELFLKLHAWLMCFILDGAMMRSCEVGGLTPDVQHAGLAKQATRIVVFKSMVKFSWYRFQYGKWRRGPGG